AGARRTAARAGGHPRTAVGRRPAAVRPRASGPGRRGPGRVAGDAGPGGRRLRRRGYPGVRPLRADRRGCAGGGSGRIGSMSGVSEESAGRGAAAGDAGHYPGGEIHPERLKELNETIRYTMWSVFRVADPLPGRRTDLVSEVESLLERLGDKDVTVRGTYDVSGMRADADLMVWWHAGSADALQEAYGLLRRTALGRHLAPVWSQVGLHRPAEFNRAHIPAFLAGEP